MPNINPSAYDPRITEGYIGVVISVEDKDLDKAKAVFEKTGSEEVKVV